MNDHIKSKAKMPQGKCPSCSRAVYVGTKPNIGDIIICKRCYAELQIVDFNPIILEWATDDSDYYEYDDADYTYQ